MTVSEYMKSNYLERGADLADFVNTVSLKWVEYEKDLDLNLPDDMITEIKLVDTEGKELCDLLPFDKEHPALNSDLYPPVGTGWADLFARKISNIYFTFPDDKISRDAQDATIVLEPAADPADLESVKLNI